MDQLFTAKPQRFHIRRKSRRASNIKASISANLSRFLADYRDDDFIEYIVVMICNGKDQYQARDDLEAFLADRSEEFVAWLWNLLSGYDLDEVPCTGPKKSNRKTGEKVDRCKDFQSHVDKDLMKGDKTRQRASEPASCDDMKLAKGSRHDLSVTVPSSKEDSRIVRRRGTGDIEDEGDRSQSKNQINQIVNRSCSGSLRNRLDLPERDVVSKNAECSLSGYRYSTQLSESNKSPGTMQSPRSVGAGSICSKTSRGSVWDRLGKPSEDISGGLESIDLFGAKHNMQYREVHNELAIMTPRSNSEGSAFKKKISYNYRGKMKNMEQLDTAEGVPYSSSNIGRKRMFGEIITCHDNDSAMMNQSNMDPEYKENFKKSSVATNDLKSIQNKELLDVKEKLNQIQIQMYNLQSKQVEFKRDDGKKNHLFNFGVQKDLGETFGSRTVLVTNVHFAATREALSLYFSRCGVVDNVVIMTDTVTSKPKGSAYVTFASKESVDKALAMSGTAFFCRTLKVLRTAGTSPTQLVWTTSPNTLHGNQISFPSKPYYQKSSLKWVRESGPFRSEQASFEGVSSSSHEEKISCKTTSSDPHLPLQAQTLEIAD